MTKVMARIHVIMERKARMMSLTKKIKKKVNMNEMQCYYCQKFDHYAQDFSFNNEFNESDKQEAQFGHASNNDYDKVLVMANRHLAKIRPMFNILTRVRSITCRKQRLVYQA